MRARVLVVKESESLLTYLANEDVLSKD